MTWSPKQWLCTLCSNQQSALHAYGRGVGGMGGRKEIRWRQQQPGPWRSPGWMQRHRPREGHCSRQKSQSPVGSPGRWDLESVVVLMMVLSFWRFQTYVVVGVDRFVQFSLALRPQRPSGWLGTGSPGRPPRLSHSSWARWGALFVQCCFTSTETIGTVRDGEPRTATPTLTQLLSSWTSLWSWVFFHRSGFITRVAACKSNAWLISGCHKQRLQSLVWLRL